MKRAAVGLTFVALAACACASVSVPSPSSPVTPPASVRDSTLAAPSPTLLPNDVVVGSTIDCSDLAMKRHCDAWTAGRCRSPAPLHRAFGRQ